VGAGSCDLHSVGCPLQLVCNCVRAVKQHLRACFNLRGGGAKVSHTDCGSDMPDGPEGSPRALMLLMLLLLLPPPPTRQGSGKDLTSPATSSSWARNARSPLLTRRSFHATGAPPRNDAYDMVWHWRACDAHRAWGTGEKACAADRSANAASEAAGKEGIAEQ